MSRAPALTPEQFRRLVGMVPSGDTQHDKHTALVAACGRWLLSQRGVFVFVADTGRFTGKGVYGTPGVPDLVGWICRSPQRLTRQADRIVLLRAAVQRWPSAFTFREREVLKARSGLECDQPHGLAEAAKRLGTTRESVRLVEAKALKRVRDLLASEGDTKASEFLAIECKVGDDDLTPAQREFAKLAKLAGVHYYVARWSGEPGENPTADLERQWHAAARGEKGEPA